MRSNDVFMNKISKARERAQKFPPRAPNNAPAVLTARYSRTTSQSMTKEPPAAFPSVSSEVLQPQYQLHNSIILDSGATDHVCNDRSRFITFTPAAEDDYLFAGENRIHITGISRIKASLKCPRLPKGRREVIFKDVLYIPSFHYSIASLRKMIAKEVH
jgi:hypothetical protein